MTNAWFLLTRISELCGVSAEKLMLATPIAELPMDSLRFTQLIVDLEHEYAIEFNDNDVEAILLAGDISDIAAAISASVGR